MKRAGEHRPTILIVEDIDWIRSSMKLSVKSYGYRVIEATNSAEAFEVLERESPEMLLTEEDVPTFDALMARLCEHPSVHNLPVIIINPDADEGARHSGAYLLTDYAHIANLLTSLRR